MAYSAVASAIFAGRNAGRTENEPCRLLVSLGQMKTTLNAAAENSSVFAKTLNKAINTYDEIAKSDKLFRGISKTVEFASKNVNPLIVCSSALNVATAKDKKSACITEGAGLIGMFACEGWMKRNLDNVLKSLPISKKWMPVVRGVAFVIGSIGASTIASKLAKLFTKTQKSNDEKYAQNQQMFVPQRLSYAA